jgi:hypothetical protein
MPANDLARPARVVVLPRRARGGPAVTARHDLSAASAIRYVMESLPAEERARAVVQTPAQSMFFLEIEALYEQPDFPRG